MDSIQRPAFPIKRVRLVDRPTDGMEYLETVITEREKCPETVHVELKNLVNNQTIFTQELPRVMTAPDIIKPTIEWQNFQVADFSKVRQRISDLYLNKPNSLELATVPKTDELEIWIQFFKRRRPDLTVVFTLDQPALCLCLDMLLDWMKEVPDGSGLEDACARWTYAILACLRIPLEHHVCGQMRDIARRCSQLRSHLPLDDEKLEEKASPLNLLICLVARYYRQLDLAD